jgi:hypothetical protein
LLIKPIAGIDEEYEDVFVLPKDDDEDIEQTKKEKKKKDKKAKVNTTPGLIMTYGLVDVLVEGQLRRVFVVKVNLYRKP